MQLGRGQCPRKAPSHVSALKPDPRQPAVNPHQTVMPKPVLNPFKILASLRLGAFALKICCMDTAQGQTRPRLGVRQPFGALARVRI